MGFTVGITGNIGSGKSTVCKIFESLGIPVFYADDFAKSKLNDTEVQHKILVKFGSSILNKKNKIDKKALAAIVFTDEQKLGELNSIIHPEVYQGFIHWKNNQRNAPYVIMEAAILFESGFNEYVDFSVNIHAEKQTRMERIIKRDKTDEESILNRIDKQFSDSEKIKRADHTIQNSGKELLIPQILELDKKFRTIKTGS